MLQTSSPFQGILIWAFYHKGLLQGGLALATTGGGGSPAQADWSPKPPGVGAGGLVRWAQAFSSRPVATGCGCCHLRDVGRALSIRPAPSAMTALNKNDHPGQGQCPEVLELERAGSWIWMGEFKKMRDYESFHSLPGPPRAGTLTSGALHLQKPETPTYCQAQAEPSSPTGQDWSLPSPCASSSSPLTSRAAWGHQPGHGGCGSLQDWLKEKMQVKSCDLSWTTLGARPMGAAIVSIIVDTSCDHLVVETVLLSASHFPAAWKTEPCLHSKTNKQTNTKKQKQKNPTPIWQQLYSFLYSIPT